MRHVRMLGLCLVAVFAMSAVAAVPALAKTPAELRQFNKFRSCPFNAPIAPGYVSGVQGCVWAQSQPESFFKAGNITVNLSKPITLLGGFEEKRIGGEQQFFGPEAGNKAVSAVAQPGPDLTEAVNPELLSPKEKTRYEKIVAAGQTKTTVTIELAGDPTSIFLSEENLINATGVALSLPVEIKLSNPFFGKNCYVGTNYSPVNIALTSGTTSPPPPNEPITGKAGIFTSVAGGEVLVVKEDVILNNEYAAPGVTGCGMGSGTADAAIDSATGLPSPAGQNTAVIHGTLEQTSTEAAQAAFGED